MRNGDTDQSDVTAGDIYEIELTSKATHLPAVAIATFAFLNEAGDHCRHPCVCFPFSKRYRAYYRYAYIKKELNVTTIGPILVPPSCVKIVVGIFDHPKNVGLVSCGVRLVSISLKTAHSATLCAADEEQRIAFLSLLSGRQIENADKQLIYDVINNSSSTRNHGLISTLFTKFGAEFYFDPKVYASFCRLKAEYKVGRFFSSNLDLPVEKKDCLDSSAGKILKVSILPFDGESGICNIPGGQFIFSLVLESGEEYNLAEALDYYIATEVNAIDRTRLDSLKQIELLAAILYAYLRSCYHDPIQVIATSNNVSLLALISFLTKYTDGNC
ncbi:hypothetical protein [Bordetella petrii]|uniref:hypothetical protein n=1 Tax=Bordetella petrii TaxID=94624 RepID=UPI001E2FED7B|nr:hypothetical protein [Bordetella petrii]MCD0501723.1 hypothetical protein [Bordetella petrii]